MTFDAQTVGGASLVEAGPGGSIAAPAIALQSRVARWFALLLLVSAYLQGGIDKAIDFSGAVSEMRHFGIEPAVPMALATIVLELGASALILAGRLRWLSAIALALFTLAATLIANRFWAAPANGRLALENAFFEHLGLTGGFLLVAWVDWRECRDAFGRRWRECRLHLQRRYS
jgi:uncharacterized membrane protein YphA (DoxX/SURF4 family)